MSQIKITDAAGLSGLFTNPVTIDPYIPPKATVFGTTPDYNNGETGFLHHMELYPVSGIARMYGADCAQWNTPHTNALVARGDRIWFSFKNFNLAPVIANWNAMMVAADYTPFHEFNRPTGGPILADYVAFIVKLFAAREAHHNKALIKLGPIASWFPAVHGKEAIKWEQVMGQDSMPWDFMGWDFYNPQNNAITPPADMLALPVASGKTYGLPVQVGEWSIQPGSYPEADAAAWVTGIGTEARKQGLRALAHWCSTAPPNPNYHLENRPLPFAALQKLLAG